LGSPGQPARLVVADDHPMVRYMLRLAMAGRSGIEIVGEAADGPETLDACTRLRPDVLVLDLVLPGLHGFEVVRRLRQEKPGIKILVLTGSDERDAELEAIRLGVDGFVEKSSSAEEIAAAIEAVAAGTTAVASVRHPNQATSSMRSTRKSNKGADDARRLTPREREVLRLIAEGMTSREMAARLEVSLSTIESHIANVYVKFGIRNRVEAAHQALALGIVNGR
jgi:two-component system response regulator NreC